MSIFTGSGVAIVTPFNDDESINYDKLDDNYMPYTSADASAPNGKGPHYDVLHPITKKPCKTPSRGWCFTRESMDELLDNNRILFGENENNVPRVKKTLIETETEVAKSIILDNTDGKKELMAIFNVATPDFTNPKPTTLIKTLLKFINSTDITVLDFFAGSGTTGQAVMELNKEDGGNRKFILCTNNEIDSNKSMELMISKYGKKPTMKKADYNKLSDEDKNNFDKLVEDWEEKYQKLLSTDECQDLGICKSITYQRLKTVITGTRIDGSKYSDGISANLKYYKSSFVAKETNNLNDVLMEYIKEMVQLENAVDIDDKRYLLLLNDIDKKELKEKIETLNVKCLYKANSILLNNEIKQQCVNKGITIIDIPEYYFKNELGEWLW